MALSLAALFLSLSPDPAFVRRWDRPREHCITAPRSSRRILSGSFNGSSYVFCKFYKGSKRVYGVGGVLQGLSH